MKKLGKEYGIVLLAIPVAIMISIFILNIPDLIKNAYFWKAAITLLSAALTVFIIMIYTRSLKIRLRHTA